MESYKMQFETKTKNYKQKVEESFKLQKFMDFIGAKLIKVALARLAFIQ